MKQMSTVSKEFLSAPGTRKGWVLVNHPVRPHFAFRLLLTAAATFSLSATLFSAELKVGDKAPVLNVSTWLGGAQAVKSYQPGTVYVLEFWATWCGSCHAAQPHINELTKKMAGKPVVFVNITNEERPLVESFLSKRPMATRVALDSKNATFDAYGVRVLPHTIVISGDGKIAAITSPQEVTETALLAVMKGDPINLPVKGNKTADLDWDEALNGVKTGTPDSLGHAILQTSDAVSGATKFVPNSGRITGDGVALQSMIQIAYGSDFDNTNYDLTDLKTNPMRFSVKAPDGKDETAKAMLRELLHRNFAFRAEWIEVEKEMPVIRFDASKGNGKFKKSTAEKPDGMARHGSINYIKVKVSQIVKVLGTYGFHQAVVDETGLSGDYDLNIRWNVADKDSFLKALTELGFSHTKEKRMTRILSVNPS